MDQLTGGISWLGDQSTGEHVVWEGPVDWDIPVTRVSNGKGGWACINQANPPLPPVHCCCFPLFNCNGLGGTTWLGGLFHHHFSNWPVEQLTKWPSDQLTSWLGDQLTSWPVDWRGQLAEVDQLTGGTSWAFDQLASFFGLVWFGMVRLNFQSF